MKKHPFIAMLESGKPDNAILANQMINELETVLNDSGSILFYPSAGTDITDVLNINSDTFIELEGESPNIFIHSDADFYYDNIFNNIHKIDLVFNNRDIQYEKVTFDKMGSLIHLYMLTIGENQKWLLNFEKTKNEDLLRDLIIKQIEVKFLYTVCDGIYYGSGIDDENERKKCISAKFYSVFYTMLKTKYHISEYHETNDRLEPGSEFLERQAKNINYFLGGLINFNNPPEELQNLMNGVNGQYLLDVETKFESEDVYNRFPEVLSNCDGVLGLRVL